MLTFKEIGVTLRNSRTEKQLPGIGRVWDYLAQRGITRETADQLGLFIVPAMDLIAAARRTPNIMPDSRAAIVFPHFSVADGEALDWWSSRLVDIAEATPKLVASFGDLVDPTKVRKMGKVFCPPNEAPRGYLPVGVGPDWGSIPAKSRVYIHESCIKAINGALLGKYSVGLNGVWGWASSKNEIALVQELRDLPWKARELEPVIVFDAGARTNWQIQAAESRLAAKLFAITGRMAKSLRVPCPIGEDGIDQGFDDFRVKTGDAKALAFLESDGENIDVSELELQLLKLNSEVCVVRSIGRIAEQATGNLMSRATFTEVNYAHYTAEIPHGDGDTRVVKVPPIWLGDTRRVEVDKLDYIPGEDRICGRSLNLWRGMGLEPEPGDAGPWLELITNNVGDEWLRNWLISWFAWPLQHPGEKLNSFPLIFGPSGVGKGLLLAPFRRIYGTNAITIANQNIKSDFNSVYSNKQLIHIDELPRLRGMAGDESGGLVMQKIKMLTTDDKMVVNEKGQPEYSVHNCANLAITSNYHDCIKLDLDDRRSCVLKWEPQSAELDHRGDQPHWIKYVEWMDGAGSAALYDFLLGWDCSGFDPKAWAPSTPWKMDVTESSMDPMDLWARELHEDPELFLPLIGQGRILWTAKELGMLYWGCSESEITHGRSKSLTNALKNAGFVIANGGKPLKPQGREGVQSRFWVIRHSGVSGGDKKWQIPTECSKHLKLFFK